MTEFEYRYIFLECVDCKIFLPQDHKEHEKHKLHAVDFVQYESDKTKRQILAFEQVIDVIIDMQLPVAYQRKMVEDMLSCRSIVTDPLNKDIYIQMIRESKV